MCSQKLSNSPSNPSLIQNEKEQTFTCLLAIRQKWKDEYLTWDPEEFDGLSQIRLPANQVWTPDLVISNL
jgi:nicotinic acetylcholine receptor